MFSRQAANSRRNSGQSLGLRGAGIMSLPGSKAKGAPSSFAPGKLHGVVETAAPARASFRKFRRFMRVIRQSQVQGRAASSRSSLCSELKGEMEGKPAGVFTSTATTHGRQETTLVMMMIPLIHLGMIIVGVHYSTQGMTHTEPRGGTPYGPTTIAGPRGEFEPAEGDYVIARALGKRVAEIAKKLRG